MRISPYRIDAFGTGYNYFGVKIGNHDPDKDHSCSYAYLRDLQIISEGKVVFQRV